MTFEEDKFRPDFAFVYSKANEILVSSKVIDTFPYKIGSLIKEELDINLCSYSKSLEKFKIDNSIFGSKSADWKEYNGANIIFYNDKEDKRRVRYSLGHETGHYVLGHNMNLKENDELYQKQEIEANCFAAQLLMPEQIIRELRHRGRVVDSDFLQEAFDVSDTAARKRIETLVKHEYEWKSRSEKEFDDIILEKYSPFIDKYASKKSKYYFINDNYEDEMQRERDSWLDPRTRWN